MKTIRNQVKYRKELQLPTLLQKLRQEGNKTVNKQKFNSNLPENAVEAVKPHFGPPNMFDCAILKLR